MHESLKIFHYLQNKRTLIIASILAISCTILTLIFNYYLGSMMNILTQPNFTKKNFQNQFLKAFILSIILVLLHAFNYESRSYAFSELTHDLRYSIYKQIMRQDISFFDEKDNSTGILVGSYLSQEVNTICSIYIIKILNAEQDVILSIGGIIIAFITMWQVALPVTIIIIILIFVYYYGDKFVDKMWTEYNEHKTESISKVNEILSSFKTVKSFNNENYEIENYTQFLNSIQKVVDRISFFKGMKDSTVNCLSNISTALFVYFACFLIVRKQELGYKSEDLLVLIFAVLFSANEIVHYLSLTDDLTKAKISAKKVLKLLEKEPIIDQEKQGEFPNAQFSGRIEFIDVGFKYKTKPKRSARTEEVADINNTSEEQSFDHSFNSNADDCDFSDHWAVRHLSFVVEAGQTVAIVGESGCGKSTALQLLSRFYEIDEGRILIDGYDISKMNPMFLHTLISTVPQEPFLFSMQVKDNIKFSRKSAKIDDVVKAAKLGNAHEFIMEIPDGYDSIVHQKSLSGGQKQRICLSRAFLPFIDSNKSNHSLILLLDEATASLDSKSEDLTHKSISEFDRENKITKLIVAHRLTTVYHADKIIVFKNGHVEEEGNHEELINNNGIYSNLVQNQLR